MKKEPLVSIVMSVYNGEKYLRNAIESILNQTYENFEFIIINDGSVDSSLKIIETYNDPRIIVINRENKGLIYSLNEGFKISKGKYIARQDADDISSKDRIYKQIEFLKKHPDIFLVGTFAKGIDAKGIFMKEINRPVIVNEEIFLRICPFIHGSVMLKKEILQKISKWYDEKMMHIEDYDFFWRISCTYKCANIPEYLYFYRIHGENISRQQIVTQSQNKYLRRLVYKKKISTMNINELSWLQKKELLGNIRRNQGHYLLRDNDIKAIYMYARSLMAYPCIKNLAFLMLSIISRKLLLRILG